MLKQNSRWRPASTFILSAALAAGSLMIPQAAHAGTAQIVDVEQGATPFLGFAGAFYYSGTIASVAFSIQPTSGSVTRPIGATYSAAYLTSHNYFIPGANAVVIPIFGLYAGATNTINITYNFTDKTSNTQTATLKTPAYTDPCAQVAQRSFYQLRPSTSALNFDYFILKDYCSANAPAVIDTDGNIRWVGDAGFGSQDTGFFNNGFYVTNGTAISRIDITTAAVTPVVDLGTPASAAATGVTVTGFHHQIDPGKTGLIVDVNTSVQEEATAIEFNPNTGAILNTWDFGAIITAAMTAGGDTPSKFVLGATADWFHNNAVAYDAKDNWLIVSSRENFVMAVDYNAPASGQRQIHWILGDTTKLWHTFPSLAKYTLNVGSSLPPIGQHGVSIDHLGNVLMFDDGLGSLTLSPAGMTRSYSAARSYQINPTALTANEAYIYTASNNGQNLFSPICGSAYDVNGTYLVDFTTANAAAAALAQANPVSTVTTNNNIVNTLLAANNTTAVVLVGVGASSNIEFISALQSPGPCAPGWNALPFASNVFSF